MEIQNRTTKLNVKTNIKTNDFLKTSKPIPKPYKEKRINPDKEHAILSYTCPPTWICSRSATASSCAPVSPGSPPFVPPPQAQTPPIVAHKSSSSAVWQTLWIACCCRAAARSLRTAPEVERKSYSITAAVLEPSTIPQNICQTTRESTSF